MEPWFRVGANFVSSALTSLMPGLALWALSANLAAQTTLGTAGIEEANPADQAKEPGVNPSKLLLGDLAAQGVAESNGVTYERWNNVGGKGVSRNTLQAGKLGIPAMKGLAPSLEFPPNDGASYASRVRGYFVAPRTGTLRFVLSSDDNSELWISPGADSFARRRSAWIAGNSNWGWTKPGEVHRVASQWTPPMKVAQGDRYYFEAYHKQGDKNDHFSVRMRYEGEKSAVPIPSESLRPWLGVATDANDDGLPDDWQRQAGIEGAPDSSAYADADGDGVSNFDEFVAGTGPRDSSPVAGMLLWEAWYGLPGSQVADLVRSARFSGRPDHSVFVTGGSTPVITAGYCGSRLSGFLVPSESGEYHVAVAGDDSTELWLSDNESSHRKERVAFGTSWRPKGDWFVPPSQQSEPVFLEAGRSYYFEAILKDGGPPGWVAIGWKKRGEKSFVEVAPSFLRSPGVPSDDKNRDFLPDQWAADALSRVPEASRARIVFTEQGDPDRDGLPNWLEARVGTSPFEKDQVVGTLIREWWLNVPGRSLAESRISGVFLKRPSMVELSRGASSEAYTADWYASRFRGYVVPPKSGKYRFWVSGDDQVEFWVSTDATKFRKKLVAGVMPEAWQQPGSQVHTRHQEWDARPGQRSVDLDLVGGESYFIELLLKDSGGDDHVALAWQSWDAEVRGWSERDLVDANALLSYEGDEDDVDDDYLPDSWEREFGLNALDNGSKDRARQGEAGDHDRDILTNREEFLLGTNPCSVDSDADGVGDYEEVKFYGSNPVRKDAFPPVLHTNVSLADVISAPGGWQATSRGGLTSTSLRGKASFEFKVESPGIYVVRLAARSTSDENYIPSIRLSGKVDGVEIGKGEVDGEGKTFSWFTQWLEAGSHTVTVDNQNVKFSARLEIESLELLRLVGDDLDNNGVPDWMERGFRAANTLLLGESEVVEFQVSPACIEGIARLPGKVVLRAEGNATETRQGIGQGWFADVPLASVGETDLEVSFEGGAIISRKKLVWKAMNPFEVPDRLDVRVADSMKFFVPDSEDNKPEVTLTVNGANIYTGRVGREIIVEFDQVGEYLIEVKASGASGVSERRFVVEAIDAHFGPRFDLASGVKRVWRLPGVPETLSMDHEQRLELKTPENKVVGAPGKQPTAYWGHPEPAHPVVLARLSPGGPIVDSTQINVFRLIDASESGDAHLVDVLPDGTRVIEVSYLIDGEIPADLSLWIDFYVTDAVFADGSTRYHLTAEDFDESGVARIKIYKAAGDGPAFVCHWNRLFEEDAQQETEETGERE